MIQQEKKKDQSCYIHKISDWEKETNTQNIKKVVTRRDFVKTKLGAVQREDLCNKSQKRKHSFIFDDKVAGTLFHLKQEPDLENTVGNDNTNNIVHIYVVSLSFESFNLNCPQYDYLWGHNINIDM